MSDSLPPSTSGCVLDTFAVRKAMQATRRDLCGWGMGYPVVPSLVMRWLSRARVVRLSAGAVCPTVNTYLLPSYFYLGTAMQ